MQCSLSAVSAKSLWMLVRGSQQLKLATCVLQKVTMTLAYPAFKMSHARRGRRF